MSNRIVPDRVGVYDDMPQGFSRSTHKPTCPEYRQQPNAENGGFVQDSAFSCNCQSSVQPGDDMEELRCTNCNRVLGFWERHSDVPFNGAPWCETCKRGLRTLPAVGRKRIDDMPKPITFGADKEEKGCKVTPQDLGHIQPLHDRVLVRRDPPEAQTQGGIVIPSVGRTEALRGLVLAVGPGKKDEQGVFHETQVKPGDRVVISGSVNVPYGDLVKDGDLVMMSEADILGIIGL
ncbi:MAG TPA: co-chaperone GroES [Candidatus Angelobacter sp.]|nr:co-chaperone GroES [Candidatus Angelobacter sp.]